MFTHRTMAIALVLALVASAASAEPSPTNSPITLPGTTVETVLVLAKSLSPTLKARALELEAARAGMDGSDSLPDPTLKVTSDEIDRTSGPRQNKMIYSVEQDIPLWGKRDLKRSSAQAAVDQRKAESLTSETELIEKVKIVFAQYYRAEQALDVNETLHRAIHDSAQTAQDRYALGRESQPEAYRSQIENTRLETERTRLLAARTIANHRLNILIGRDVDAPLAKPQRMRDLPPMALLNPTELIERAHRTNPQLAAGSAEIAGAQSERSLAEKEWYPDVTVGAGAIDRTGNGPNGYMAWVGMRVPLQWGLHDAQEREASARAQAAEARRQAVALQLADDLAEASSALAGNLTLEKQMRMQLLPQTETLLTSVTASYAAGRTSFQDVLKAEQELADLHMQLLDIDLDAQRQLAAIERMIGSDL